MEYSKMESIELTNFMSYKHAIVTFDDSGIINLKGYNGFGKSTILRAVAICTCNAYKKNQVKYIRHGESYFRIVIRFSDGVAILKDKYKNGQTMYEMYRGDKLEYSSKEGNILIKVDDVPDVIAEYLGLCISEDNCLNFADRDKPYLLVDTTGFDNYKLLHDILKAVEISRATQLIISDRNRLSGEVANLEYTIRTDESVLESVDGVDEGIILDVTERSKIFDLLTNQEKEIKGIDNTYTELKNIKNIPKLKLITNDELKKICEVNDILTSLKGIKDIPTMEKVDLSRVKKVSKLGDSLVSLKNLKDIPKVEKLSKSKLEVISNLVVEIEDLQKLKENTIPNIDLVGKGLKSKVKSLKNIISNLSASKSALSVANNIEKELDDNQKELNSLLKTLKDKGYAVTRCKNCGNLVDVNLGEV